MFSTFDAHCLTFTVFKTVVFFLSYIPLMFSDNSQNILWKVLWVFWKPKELLQLSFNKFHLCFLFCQSVLHTLKNNKKKKKTTLSPKSRESNIANFTTQTQKAFQGLTIKAAFHYSARWFGIEGLCGFQLTKPSAKNLFRPHPTLIATTIRQCMHLHH